MTPGITSKEKIMVQGGRRYLSGMSMLRLRTSSEILPHMLRMHCGMLEDLSVGPSRDFEEMPAGISLSSGDL